MGAFGWEGVGQTGRIEVRDGSGEDFVVEEGVGEEVVHGAPLSWISDEHAAEQGGKFGGHGGRHGVLASDDFEDGGEGEGGGQEVEQDDGKTPDVDGGAQVALADHHFRGGELGSAAEGGAQGGVVDVGAEAKVYQLDVEVGVEHDVLQGQVAVDDALGVAVGDGGRDLREEATSDGQGNFAGWKLAQILAQLTAAVVFHQEKDAGRGDDGVEQFGDVGVVELTQSVDF